MMVAGVQILFFAAVSLILYVYAGYPALLYLLSRWRRNRVFSQSSELPRVSLLISAYNESAVIAEKSRNALTLDYPRGRIEILVISDCSDDGTDEIVKTFAPHGVRLVRLIERLGKSAGLNLGAQQASGDIFVFSDANAMYLPDAIRQLVQHFADPRVGYVVGNARYIHAPGQPTSAESEGLYWKLETWMKEKESDFGSVVGGDGAIYAIRRKLFTPLLPTDINDFLNPLQIIACGYRGVYEPSAICYEEAGDSFEKEFHRKVRIISRSLNALRRAPRVLLPWVQPRHWFALVSHKVLRWSAPVFLLFVFFGSLLLWQWPFYHFAAVLQFCFYALAAVGWAGKSRGSIPKILYLPYYFCLVNLASLLGIFKFLSGSLSPTWRTVRQEDPPNSESAVHPAGVRVKDV
jgi:cellulose synthase/poly-beta-1,6-N-acetylglucosamine synthase-like glycosyltransferase